MPEIHGHLSKKSTCAFPKSRNGVEKGGRAKRAPSTRRTMVRKMPVISTRSGDRTVAILAQGTSWADAATQAFLQKSRILSIICQLGIAIMSSKYHMPAATDDNASSADSIRLD